MTLITVMRRALPTLTLLICSGFSTPLLATELDDIEHLAESGKYQQALVAVQNYLSRNTGNERALFLQALTLQKMGRINEAISNYEALTRIQPDSPEPWNNLAVLYAAQGDHTKARDALLKAIHTHPSYSTAYENLGDIYAKMAVSAYNRALETGKKDVPGPITLTNIDKLARTGTAVASSAPTPPATDDKTEFKKIGDTVSGWLNAWSGQNIENYIAYYAEEFRPASNISRTDWERQRRVRLTKPSFIKISIKNTDVFLIDAESARFSFDQTYESDSFNDLSRKTLILKKVADQWKIVREYVEG